MPRLSGNRATTDPAGIAPRRPTAVQTEPGNNEEAQESQCPINGAHENVNLKVPLLEKLPLPCDSLLPRNNLSKAQPPASPSSEMQMTPSLSAKIRVPMVLPSKAKSNVLRSRASSPSGPACKSSTAARPPAELVTSHRTAQKVPTVEVKQRSKKVCQKRPRVLRKLTVNDCGEDASNVPLEKYCKDGSVSFAEQCRNTCTVPKQRTCETPGVKRKISRLDDMKDVSDAPMEENGSRRLSSDSTRTKPGILDCTKKTNHVDTVPPEAEPLPPVIVESSSMSTNSSHLVHPETGADIQARGNSTSDGAENVALQAAHEVDASLQVEDKAGSTPYDEPPNVETPGVKAVKEPEGADRAPHETDCVNDSQHENILGNSQAHKVGTSGAPEGCVRESGKPLQGGPHSKAPTGAMNLEKNVQPAGCTSNTKKTLIQGNNQNNAKSSRMKRKQDLNGTECDGTSQETCVPHKTKVIPKKATKEIQSPTNGKNTDDLKDSAFANTKLPKKKNLGVSETTVAVGSKKPEPTNTQIQGTCTNEVKKRTSEKIEDISVKRLGVQNAGDHPGDKEIAPLKRTGKMNSNKSSKVEAALSSGSMKSPSAVPTHKDHAAVLALKKSTMNPNRFSVEDEYADNSNKLQLTCSAEAESHKCTGAVGPTLSRNVEENPGPSLISRNSTSGGAPTTVQKTVEKKASLPKVKGNHATGSKHVPKGDASTIWQTPTPRNQKKRRASASEIEEPHNLQNLVHAGRGGSAERQTKPYNKKKRSASLTEGDKVHCVEDLKLLDTKEKASLPKVKECHATCSKHVPKGDASTIWQTSSLRNQKKQRASVSEIEESCNLQNLVRARRGGSAERQSKPCNKRKRSASLTDVDKADCVGDLKLLDTISSQSIRTIQARQPTQSDLSLPVSTVKQTRPPSKDNRKLPEVDNAHHPEDLKYVATTPSQELCSSQIKQPTQPSPVDINANEVEAQSTHNLENEAATDVSPTAKECDTLKAASQELKIETAAACKPEDMPDSQNQDISLQPCDTATDSKDVKPCKAQFQDVMLGSDDGKPYGLQHKDVAPDSENVRPCDLKLQDIARHSEDVKEEVLKPPYLQLEHIKSRPNKKVKKKSSSGTNTSMRSVWCFSRKKKSKKAIKKKTDDESGNIKTVLDTSEASVAPQMMDNGTKFAPDDLRLENMQCNDSATEGIQKPVNIPKTKLCSSATVEATVKHPGRVMNSIKKKTADKSGNIKTVLDTSKVPVAPQMMDNGTKFAPDDLHLETMQCNDSATEGVQKPVNIPKTKLCSSATVEATVKHPGRVMNSSKDCKVAAATAKIDSNNAVSDKQKFLSRNIMEQKDAIAALVRAPQPKASAPHLKASAPQPRASAAASHSKAFAAALQCKYDVAQLQRKVTAVTLQPMSSGPPLWRKDSVVTLQPTDIVVPPQTKTAAATWHFGRTLPGYFNAPQGETAASLRSSLLELDLAAGLSILDVCQTDSSKLKVLRDRARGSELSKEQTMCDVAKAVHGAIIEEYFKRERAVRTLNDLAKIPFSREPGAVARTRQLIQVVVANATDKPKSAP